jgi:hypothetical protein
MSVPRGTEAQCRRHRIAPASIRELSAQVLLLSPGQPTVTSSLGADPFPFAAAFGTIAGLVRQSHFLEKTPVPGDELDADAHPHARQSSVNFAADAPDDLNKTLTSGQDFLFTSGYQE